MAIILCLHLCLWIVSRLYSCAMVARHRHKRMVKQQFHQYVKYSMFTSEPIAQSV